MDKGAPSSVEEGAPCSVSPQEEGASVGRQLMTMGGAVDASMLKKKRNAPLRMMPSLNWIGTLWPGWSGVASVMKSAESEELKPPPLGCKGGSSRRTPRTVTTPMLGDPASPSCEVSARTSAQSVPPHVFSVPGPVMLKTRKRRRVTAWPVLFVKVRRMSSEPGAAFGSTFGGPTRFGTAPGG